MISKYHNNNYLHLKWYINSIKHTVKNENIVFHIKDYYKSYVQSEPIKWMDIDVNGNTYESDEIFDDFDSIEIFIEYPFINILDNSSGLIVIDFLILMIKRQIANVNFHELTSDIMKKYFEFEY